MDEYAQQMTDPKVAIPQALAVVAERFDGEKTREQIEAEKAAKPRPDLLPWTAIEMIAERMPKLVKHTTRELVTMAWEDLAWYTKEPSATILAEAAVSIAVAIALIDEVPLEAALPHACMRGGFVMGYGRRKHGRMTWRVPNTDQASAETHSASAARHCIEWLIDETATETGSKLPVLLHAFSQVCIAIDCIRHPAASEAST